MMEVLLLWLYLRTVYVYQFFYFFLGGEPCTFFPPSLFIFPLSPDFGLLFDEKVVEEY